MALPDDVTDTGATASERVAVGVRSRGNSRLLNELLADYTLSSLFAPGVDKWADHIDLVIVDAPTLAQYRDALAQRRQAESPVILPVLLIVEGRADSASKGGLQELGTCVDEIVWIPTRRQEIRARVANLLRLRALSRQQQLRLEQTSEALYGTSRALHTLHATNSVLVRASDEQGLLEAICRVIVEQERYPCAWIGFVDTRSDPAIQITAAAGDHDAYFNHKTITYSQFRHGPAWRAIENQHPVVSPDLATDPGLSSLHDQIRDHGLASAIALPIHLAKGTSAVLVIYSRVVGDFRDDEREVLERLAHNLEYGINALRTHAERDRQKAAIEDLAYSDRLTWLPNRNYLSDRLDELLVETTTPQRRLAVFFIDLDDFKLINDALGHETGDTVLRQVGQRLRQAVRSNDLVARHGGDEFIVVMREQPRSSDWAEASRDCDVFADAAYATGRRLAECLSRPLRIDGREHRVGVSIGFTIHPRHGSTAQELINGADTAMYDAKSGGDNVRVYTDAIAATRQRRLSMGERLHNALETGEFRLHYQPIFELATGAIIGVEALVRWPQSDGSFISPGEFIPLAEETGLIIPLGDWVLRTALTQRAAWAEMGHDLMMSVNVSVDQIRQPAEAGGFLMDQHHAVDPTRIELEVTESGLLDERGTIQATLERLHERGFYIAVDDFGTGQSSLSRLQAMPLNTLKIDKAFIAGLGSDGRGAVITRAVHQLANGLGMRSLAEGVETDAQRRALLELGCQVGQGFWLSAALPPDDLLELVRDQQRRGILAVLSSH